MQVVNYLVNYFEKWRLAVPKHYKPLKGKDLTDFYMIGHSLGGYLSAHYALQFT